MSVLVIGGAAVVVSVALTAWFWNRIVNFVKLNFIPYIREKLGDGVADALANVFGFLDDVMVLARRSVKWIAGKVAQGWRWFRTHILKMQTTYRKNSDGTYVEIKENEMVTGVSGNQVSVEVRTETRSLPWEELPADFRHKIITQNATEATFDDKATIEEKFRKRAEEEKLDLTVS